jgi:hypothetical protein
LNPFTQVPRPFYWESPDGSRTLVWNADTQMAYPEGYQLRLAHSYGGALPLVMSYLERLQASGYPYAEVGFRMAQDNAPPVLDISYTIRDWNARWAFPRLNLSTNYQFLHTMEERHRAEIPAYRAAWPDWWSDYYLCDAKATGVLRLAHEWLSAAERLSALVRLTSKESPPDAEGLAVARQRILITDEPVWGYALAADRPEDWRTRGAYSEKAVDIYTGAVNARAVALEAAGALYGKLLDSRSFVVFNPLGWPRDGTVQVDLPWGYDPQLSGLSSLRSVRDKENHAITPMQFVRSDNAGKVFEFQAQAIPAMGYRVYELFDQAPENTEAQTVRVGDDTLESEFYRIRADAQKGGIVSIYDKELNRELVDSAAPGAFGRYIYERPPGGNFDLVWGGMPWGETLHTNNIWLKRPTFERFSPLPVKVSRGQSGPVFYSLIIEGATEMTPVVRQEIILRPGVKRVEIVNTIRKQEIVAAESAYFAFPFAAKNPVVRYEGTDTIITPEQGQLPLSARDWYAIQHWVTISDGAADIVWTPLEAPLVQFGGIHTVEWQKKLPLENGSLYSFVMSNYWMTNTRPSQGGDMTFRYSFTSQRHTSDDVPATRFGWDQMSPFIVVGPFGPPASWLRAPQEARPPAEATKPAGSFCEISAANVLLVSFKIADDGAGYVVRLLEFSGKPTRADVRFGPLTVSRIVAADAVEGEQAPAGGEGASVKAGGITVDLRPFELKTLRIFFGD